MSKRTKTITICAIVLLMIGIMCLIFVMPLSMSNKETAIYVDNDDTADSVWAKIDSAARPIQLVGLKSLAALTKYNNSIHTGQYKIGKNTNSLSLIRKLKNGRQDPLRLIVQSVRTKRQLADKMGHDLMMKPDSLYELLNDSSVCAHYNTDTANIIGLFLPNTYEVYWNMTPSQLLDRMKRESDVFWTTQRKQQAASLNLSPEEVITIASIVEEETANEGEKSMIAGMYLNRLERMMPLQADPTVKFALQRFELKRIYRDMLRYPSPYNTYVNVGLPPGPIRIPSIKGIEAVLHAKKHDYLYMCAKEDFSGTHNFAKTYNEHLANAQRYSEALNKRGIQ